MELSFAEGCLAIASIGLTGATNLCLGIMLIREAYTFSQKVWCVLHIVAGTACVATVVAIFVL